ncbi:hypothetical protein N5A93_06370 [Roseovarius sp. EGI FJ00037]|uniref:hypothetical protein n=1 Tax=Roseovarius salincola TaxID=2978479 RepID=UPI0022A80BB0|nr:hypothetical protein [Roseovarius sp. EGI FJ00037]MCZ0811850.1 hypothetical protein [Roseovarius sp. EGI FJ00037]
MTETKENPSFISGDFAPVAEFLKNTLTEIDQSYEPDMDSEQMDALARERELIFGESTQVSYIGLEEVIPQRAVEEKIELFDKINSAVFFRAAEVPFIVNPSRRSKKDVLENHSSSEFIDRVIDKMCVAMKAVGINDQTIFTVKSAAKINIENSFMKNEGTPPIPEVAPKKYRGVIQDGPPVEFIRSVYAQWLMAEVLDRETLNQLDQNLVLAVYSYKKRNPSAPTLKNVLASKSAATENRKKIYGVLTDQQHQH